jgi:hypothetical protein
MALNYFINVMCKINYEPVLSRILSDWRRSIYKTIWNVNDVTAWICVA